MDLININKDASGQPIIALDAHGNSQGVHEGFAKLNPVSFQNQNTIVDINGNTQDSNQKDYFTLVSVQYTVRRIDIYTGKQKPDEVLAPGKVPEQLNNGDVIMVDLVSLDPDYLLSNPKHAQVTISGLVTIVAEDVYDPTFTFDGASGKGSISNITAPPRRTK